MKFNIEGRQKLTSEGKIGVGLVLLSPIAAGLSVAALRAALMNIRSGDEIAPLLFLLGSAMAFLIGLLLIFLGRTFHYSASPVDPSSETKGLWQS